MSIQELTRQMIIDELLMIGCVTGHMGVAEFVRKVYPKANSLPTTDYRFGMTTEYSCAVTPQVRQTGNRLSGLAGTAYASLLT